MLFVAENITTDENQYLVHYSIQMYLKLIGVMESAERDIMKICKSESTKGNLCLLLFCFSSEKQNKSKHRLPLVDSDLQFAFAFAFAFGQENSCHPFR